jgi:Domain of unknown function (DUF4190)
MFCPNCGAPIQAASLVCASCGWREPVRSASLELDPAMRVLLPVGRSFYAIIAGYLGLISVLVFPAPFAILFGFLALRDIKRHPEKGGRGRAVFGLIMGTMFTLLPVAMIAIAALTSRS